MTTNPNIINHIALVLDASLSMRTLATKVIEVADAQIAQLAQISRQMDQETRVSVYTFDTHPNDPTDRLRLNCLFYDKDVLRLPSIKGLYRPEGNTPLIDATLQVISDLEKTPQLYGDHSFLLYGLTDGANNVNNHMSDKLRARLEGLPDNWTVALFVPDQNGVFYAKKFGFPANNIAVWNADVRGVEKVGETIRQTTQTYMTQRSQGVRSSRNLFQVNTAQLDPAVVSATLASLHPGQYRMYDVDIEGEDIAKFVERQTNRAYRAGEAYYQLTKKETIQGDKKVALFQPKGHKLYVGAEARSLLGLPDFEVKVAPDDFKNYEIFVQSKSVNRHLVAGTHLLILS